MMCYVNLEANLECNYTPFCVFETFPEFKGTIEPSNLTH